MNSLNPVTATTHADPYAYYRELLNGPPLIFDPSLRLWVASRAGVVQEILAHPDCHVRPLSEPVPKAVTGTSAGGVFGQLVRMNDGEKHARPKLALQKALSQIDLESASTIAAKFSKTLSEKHAVPAADGLSQWIFETPIFTIASLLGFEEPELETVAEQVGNFVACLSPLSTSDQLACSSNAADQLLLRFKGLMQASTSAPESVICQIQNEAEAIGWQQADAITANLLGLLSQTYEATAGLIGNSVVALMRDAGLRREIVVSPNLSRQLVEEVSRTDPPVQNTRRFAAKPLTIGGAELNAGEAILLLLAAANYDPSLNAQPEKFLLNRDERHVFGFGHGRHGCPGQLLAYTIAASAIEQLIKSGCLPDSEQIVWSYRPSVNGRIPVFSSVTSERNDK
jgi:cytochrome P450